METIFKAIFASTQDICDEFSIEQSELEPYDVLYAYYDYAAYDGNALVILQKKDDKSLWEVHAGHCSCYGLEDQFYPELSAVEAIDARLSAECKYMSDFLSVEDWATVSASLRN